MLFTTIPAGDVQLLNDAAEALLWAGHDRAADAIYALIHPDTVAACDCTAGQWSDVFAG